MAAPTNEYLAKISRSVVAAAEVPVETVSTVTSRVYSACNGFLTTRAKGALKEANASDVVDTLQRAIQEAMKAPGPAFTVADENALFKLQNACALVKPLEQRILTDETRAQMQQLVMSYSLEIATLKAKFNTSANQASDIIRLVSSL